MIKLNKLIFNLFIKLFIYLLACLHSLSGNLNLNSNKNKFNNFFFIILAIYYYLFIGLLALVSEIVLLLWHFIF